MKTTGKSAFTILELLVVIGIIGILMGVIISQFGGATESAKAARCETNMKNLVNAAHACAVEDPDGNFPPASSFSYRQVDTSSAKLVYHNYRIGWIAGSERREGPSNNYVTKNRVAFRPIPFNADYDTQLQALKGGVYNYHTKRTGSMWKAMGANRTAYQCPVHSEAALKINHQRPGWSYVMNKEFGNDDDEHRFWQNIDSITIAENKNSARTARNASKVLMFAELQAVKINDAGRVDKNNPYDESRIKAGGEMADAVLDYEKESIGFNHQIGNQRIAGHVAFADGHVARLTYATTGLSMMKLTEALCKGHEVSYTTSQGYRDLQQ